MSKILPEIQKHERELVAVIEDGSAKTYVYKDLSQKAKNSPWRISVLWDSLRKTRKRDRRHRAQRRNP